MTTTPPESLFNRLEPLLAQVTKPIQYVGGELNAVTKDWVGTDVHWALMYPDAYEVGQPNQGVAILYEVLNERDWILAERTYSVWPDMEAQLRAHGIPQFTLDAHRPVGTRGEGGRRDVAGLQEQHVHSGTVSGRQVRHDGVRGHRAGHNQGVAERVGRPGEYLVGAAARAGRTGEACGRLPREGLQFGGRAAASRPMWFGHGTHGVDFDAHRSASSSARCAQWAKDSPGSRSVANRRVMRST